MQYEQIFGLFTKATEQERLPLGDEDIEQFAKKAAFALQAKSTTKNQKFTSTLTLPVRTEEAEGLARRLRKLLGVGDLEPLLQLPAIFDEILNISIMTVRQRSVSGACA